MSRRGKGKAVKHQNEIRDMIRTVFCPPFNDEDITSRPMGNPGADIIISPVAREAIPFDIECKRHEPSTWNGTYKSSFEQTFNRESFNNSIPLLVRRKNRSGNHFFAYMHHVLEIHPAIMRDEKLIAHDNLRTFAKTNMFCIQLYSDYIHFNDKKFIEILSCLKKSYSL